MPNSASELLPEKLQARIEQRHLLISIFHKSRAVIYLGLVKQI